jgi:type I restriction enzyme S subunit
VLGTWDTAIEQTTELLKALRARHRGLMHQLLTGKVRLPGFGGEWRSVKLGEVFKERNQSGYNNLPLLSITAEKGVINRDELEKRDTSNEDKSKYKRICVGDIGYNTMRMWQGRSAVSSLEGIVSPAYTIVTPKEGTDVQYMGHLFKLPEMIHRFYRNSQGLVDDTLNCKFPEFAKVRVAIPSTIQEQRAIAQVLDASLKEIQQQEAKLEVLREQKRGLMHCLLTGRVRVPVA